MENKNLTKIYYLVLTSLFTALIIIGTLIKISVIPPVPFTLQVLFVFLSGMLLGPLYGSLSCVLYIIIGLIGIPVFTTGGGPSQFFSPTFGYIIGFALAALVIGILTKGENTSFLRYFLASLVAIVIIYAVGFTWLYVVLNFVKGANKPFMALFKGAVLLFIPADILKALIASGLAKALKPTLNKKLL